MSDVRLASLMAEYLKSSPSGRLDDKAVRLLASGLRGRSNHPTALLFDALQHPGVDAGWHGAPSCLELKWEPDAALEHVVLDLAPAGGSWHSMHEATRTLSPGPWMELPGFSLAEFLCARWMGALSAPAWRCVMPCGHC